jgi:hypothetical protein
LIGSAPSAATAAIGQINKLSDVSFTALNPLVSTTSAESVCAYSSGLAKMYTITATGSGVSGAFTLSGGGGLTLVYGVQWSGSSGAASGSVLVANASSPPFTSTATLAGCILGPSTTATLIVTLDSSDLQTALAGVSYAGTLNIVLTAQ